MTTTVIDVVLVVVLFVLGGVGFVRAMQLRATGGRYSLALARAIGCIAVGVVLAIVTAAVTR